MKNLRYSFINAGRGVYEAAKERNMRIHLCFSFYVVLAGFVLDISNTEWACVLICIALVLTAECFNTAIEALCDAVCPEYNPAIGKVKDITAASVLICAWVSVAAGCVIFFGKGRPGIALEYFKDYKIITAAIILSLIAWLFIIFKPKDKNTDIREKKDDR